MPFAQALFKRQWTFICGEAVLIFLFALGCVWTWPIAVICLTLGIVLLQYYLKSNNETFDDMQKLPLALLNGSRGYGRAKDAEFRVAVDIVGFFALGFLPDGGRVFHAYSSYPMMSTVWAGA